MNSDGWREFEFRDGKRMVPPHLAVIMGTVETFKLTYHDAIEEANRQMVRSHFNTKLDQTILGHFRRNR